MKETKMAALSLESLNAMAPPLSRQRVREINSEVDRFDNGKRVDCVQVITEAGHSVRVCGVRSKGRRSQYRNINGTWQDLPRCGKLVY
jgi:hypothetical protein